MNLSEIVLVAVCLLNLILAITTARPPKYIAVSGWLIALILSIALVMVARMVPSN
jgi:hypothetical protein